ncbi:hypothetical protein BDF19DRAFT_440303 [Syncephalis fuscata]|nr:hypothetical protein BDF19DRAFT_440303 [Syncephalis fuscata]
MQVGLAHKNQSLELKYLDQNGLPAAHMLYLNTGLFRCMQLLHLFALSSIMSLKSNNNMLPKVWQIVELVHHISLLSGTTATIALACTCKALYSAISCNSLWYRLYMQTFPRDINTDIDWLQWQLEHEQAVSATVADTENKATSRFTWFQRYSQRINMGLNWQENKPTSTVYLRPFHIDTRLKLRNPGLSIVASYPGWIAIATYRNFEIALVKLSPKNTAKIYPLDLSRTGLVAIKNITFFQHRQRTNEVDNGLCVILHLKYDGKPLDVLQIWNANSRQLLQSIDFDGEWDGRIINTSLLFARSKIDGCAQLFCSSFSRPQLREPQFIKTSETDYSDQFRIHTTDSSKMIFLKYYAHESTVSYKITCMPLASHTSSILADHSTAQTTTIASGYLTLANNAIVRRSKFYSIDCDRVLLYCNDCLPENTPNGSITSWQHSIKVISLSKGPIFERSYSAKGSEDFILIPRHNLAIFCSKDRLPLVIISLLDGKIRQYTHISALFNTFVHFQHLIDTKIVGYDYILNRYCIVDVKTDKVNVHPFPISRVEHCTVAFGHMILMNKEATLIRSFVPELV